MAGLLKDLWTGELISHFRHEQTFLSRVPNADNFVNNDTINLADMGADPAVLVNNNTYPIASAQRTDTPIVIALDKLETENTIITDDELYALPYDMKGSVVNQHREVLEEKAAEKSLHSLCPLADGANTPIVYSTGDSNGEATPRKRLVVADLVKLKKYLDLLKVPRIGRELVLNPWHVADLLMTNEAFEKQWMNKKSGEILDMFGFIISEMGYYPVFDPATGQKKAFGAAAAPTDLAASVCFYNRRAVQAKGSANMYYAEASRDPKYRQSEVGFRIHHICIPKKNTGFAALVSNTVN
jgi:hypothetical protein